MRAWTGPAVLSFGFRPFFLLGALWAALAMALWIGILAGVVTLPSAFDPLDWHAHAFVMGYLSAIVAGFLLTAVPNWTGRLPVVGWRLGLLAALWLVGRMAVLSSALLPAGLVLLLDLSCLVTLVAFMLREIVAGKNWRNLMVVTLVGTLIVGNTLFHWQVMDGQSAAHGSGLRMMLAAGILLISIIGGRIVPSFTRNWLVKTGRAARPTPPMARFDKATLLLSLGVLIVWVIRPTEFSTGIGLIAMGVAHGFRMSRWSGFHTLAEPLVWVLHVAYAFVPLGAVVLGVSVVWPFTLDSAAGMHLWMAGAIGLMTLAVMTRATLGHTGQDLRAGAGTVAIYLAMIGSVLARFIAGIWPEMSGQLYLLSGGLWCLAFLGFVLVYGPLLMRPKLGK